MGHISKQFALIVLILTSWSILHAGQSVVVGGPDPGMISYAYTLTSNNETMRWEFRVHNFGGNWFPTHSGGANWLIEAGQTVNGDNNIGANVMYWGQGEGVGYSDHVIGGIGEHVPPTGVGDMLIRIQRDPRGTYCSGSACYIIETCWTLGGDCQYQTWTGISMQSAGTTLNFVVIPPAASESASPTYAVAFYRVFPTLVQPGVSGTGLVNPIAVQPPATPSTLIGDWEFEGNLSDSSGNAGPFTITSPASVSYIATPAYAPSCNPGIQQSLRAGSSISLTGSGQSLNGVSSALTYLWQQAPGVSPVPAVWTSGQTAMGATAILPQFGPYDFQLTVTDSTANSTSCVVHDGAAATDDNGVVVYPTNSFTSAVNQFLGPIIQWGKNPWTWYDTTHKLAADANIATMAPPLGSGLPVTYLGAAMGATDTTITFGTTSAAEGTCGPGNAIIVDSEQIQLAGQVGSTAVCNVWQRGYRNSTVAAHLQGAPVNQFLYWDWWNWSQGPGTITVTGGSGTITGAGTRFESGGNYALCNGSGVANGNSLIVWHSTDTAIHGNQSVIPASCSSDTSLTIYGAGGNGAVWSTGIPAGTYSYSIATNSNGYWLDPNGDPRTMDYYDNAVAYYLLYLRSGIDTYLTAARTAADYWFYSPYINQGYNIQQNSWGSSAGAVLVHSFLGLWLRAFDSPQAEMYTGLERATEYSMYEQSWLGSTTVGDQRYTGYELSELSYLALLDPNPNTYNLTGFLPGMTSSTWSAAALYELSNLVNPSSTMGWNMWPKTQTSTGLWAEAEPEGGWCSCPSGMNNYNNGGSTSNQTVNLANGSAAVVGTNTNWTSALVGQPIWFWHGAPATFPASNTSNSADAATFVVLTVTDATHLTLSANYSYASCSACGYQTNSDDEVLGWGAYGYMFGILTNGMQWVAQALGPTDPTDSAYARTFAENGNSYLLNHARRTDTNGLNYGVTFVNCGDPVAQTNYGCSVAQSDNNSLGNSAEGLLPWITQYRYNQDPATKAAADAMYNQMWAKPGTCAGAPCNDTVTTTCAYPPCYLSNWEPANDGYLNGFGTGIPQPKWLGQYMGFGNYSAWPAVRLGGVASSAAQPFYVAFSLASVANAANVVVTVTAPNGTAASTTCTASPCAVAMPRADQPGYSIRLQYKSASGAVLASSSLPAIATR